MIKTISTDKAPAAIGPYSQAKVVGNLVFTSGQIAINPQNGEIEAVTIEEQTKQVCENIKNLLEASGTSIEKTVKTTVFIQDMKDFAVVNKIYETYFANPYPARSCVEVSRLPKDVLIEVEVIAEI